MRLRPTRSVVLSSPPVVQRESSTRRAIQRGEKGEGGRTEAATERRKAGRAEQRQRPKAKPSRPNQTPATMHKSYRNTDRIREQLNLPRVQSSDGSQLQSLLRLLASFCSLLRLLCLHSSCCAAPNTSAAAASTWRSTGERSEGEGAMMRLRRRCAQVTSAALSSALRSPHHSLACAALHGWLTRCCSRFLSLQSHSCALARVARCNSDGSHGAGTIPASDDHVRTAAQQLQQQQRTSSHSCSRLLPRSLCCVSVIRLLPAV